MPSYAALLIWLVFSLQKFTCPVIRQSHVNAKVSFLHLFAGEISKQFLCIFTIYLIATKMGSKSLKELKLGIQVHIGLRSN